jgi:protein-S-isoprenylcysteine O-methyltransferase Ste14
VTGKTLPSVLGLTTIGALFTVLVPLPAVVFGPWYITHWMEQPAFFGLEALRYVGMALIPVGLIVYWKGVTTLGREGVNPIPVPAITHFVTSGIFARPRNPMYVGAITFDQPVLMKQFPEVYGKYKRTVPMWIPRPPGRS